MHTLDMYPCVHQESFGIGITTNSTESFGNQQTIRGDVTVDGVRYGAKYISDLVYDVMFNVMEMTSNNLILGLGQILSVFIPGLSVTLTDFVTFNKDGVTQAFGMNKDGKNFDIKLGSGFHLSLPNIFDSFKELIINNQSRKYLGVK